MTERVSRERFEQAGKDVVEGWVDRVLIYAEQEHAAREAAEKQLQERESYWQGRLESSWRREDISANLRLDLFRVTGSLRSALAELVALKDGPRDEDYERRKPLAWQAARDLLTLLDSQSPADDRREA